MMSYDEEEGEEELRVVSVVTISVTRDLLGKQVTCKVANQAMQEQVMTASVQVNMMID